MDFDLDEAFVDDSSTWVDFSPLYDNVEIDSGDEERWRETAMASASLSSASESVSPHVEVFALSASCGDNADTVALSSSFSSLTPVASESVAATHSSLGVVWSAPSGQQCNPDDPEFVRRFETCRDAASQSQDWEESHIKELEVRCQNLTAQVVQLQRAVAATSMENVNLKDELVRVTKSEEAIVNTGVSQRAVREGNSLQPEFLRHRSYNHPLSHTSGYFQGFLLALPQLLMLAAVAEPSDPQTSLPQPLPEERANAPMWVQLYRALGGGIAARGSCRRKKRNRRRYNPNSRWPSRPSERKLMGRHRRRVKHLPCSRIL